LSFCILSPSPLPHVCIAVHFNYSVHWKLWYNVKWSIDFKAKVFVKTLGSCLFSLVKI
jgi:hypothetical protein